MRIPLFAAAIAGLALLAAAGAQARVTVQDFADSAIAAPEFSDLIGRPQPRSLMAPPISLSAVDVDLGDDAAAGGPQPRSIMEPPGGFSAGPLDVDSDLPTSLAAPDVVGSLVPEPASWALMTLGFGGLGAVLRHRRRTELLAL